jgi:hypothetical protein
VFEIENQKIDEFILTKNSIFYIKENILAELTSQNKTVLNILKRAFLKKYSKNLKLYSEFQKTSLSPEEILDINQIKNELEKILSLETN